MTNFRVLVVDDDPSIREVVSELLQMEGYTPILARDGAQALGLAVRSSPDLILLDMRMPGLTGWDVARELQARGSRVPIVVMTAATNAQRWAREIHADGYIAKPFDVGELLAAVEHFCP